MTVFELIATLRQGCPVTPRLVHAVIDKLERLAVAERSLAAALGAYGHADTVTLTREESDFVETALEDQARLKTAVGWLLECEDCGEWMQELRGYVQPEMEEIYAAARNAVRGLTL